MGSASPSSSGPSATWGPSWTNPEDVPAVVVDYVSEQLGLDPGEFAGYSTREVRWDHQDQIRGAYGYAKFVSGVRERAEKRLWATLAAARTAGQTAETPAPGRRPRRQAPVRAGPAAPLTEGRHRLRLGPGPCPVRGPARVRRGGMGSDRGTPGAAPGPGPLRAGGPRPSGLRPRRPAAPGPPWSRSQQ
ncbi:DUF4158 domain-containing protein [Streptomyces flaveolus]|uniref:DUF4158 domain-containing protein n=1 Tax=Streptomyces flaveolus TaxID=67297 RepID=UPI0036FC9C6F